MLSMPEEQRLLERLQRTFDITYSSVLIQAKDIYLERAPLYDVETPVWHRVAWPDGYLHEVKKKWGRVENTLAGGPDLAKWPKVREEALDMINYLAFMIAFGDMYFASDQHDPEPAQGTPFVSVFSATTDITPVVAP